MAIVEGWLPFRGQGSTVLNPFVDKEVHVPQDFMAMLESTYMYVPTAASYGCLNVFTAYNTYQPCVVLVIRDQ